MEHNRVIVAVPVFKTELRGASCADGSTPSLLRQVFLSDKLFKKLNGSLFCLVASTNLIP